MSEILLGLRTSYVRPLFIIDRSEIRFAVTTLRAATPGVDIFYMAKANSHPAVLDEITALGCGVAISHTRELSSLHESVRLGVVGPHIPTDLLKALSDRDVAYISINSVDAAAEAARTPSASLLLARVGGASAKFAGVDVAMLEDELHSRGKRLDGLHIHAGTNIDRGESWQIALTRERHANLPVRNAGGGFPAPSRMRETGQTFRDFFGDRAPSWTILEPGRYLVDDACYCVTKIVAVDQGRVFLDIASNVLPPLHSSRYVARALVRSSEIVEDDKHGRELQLYDAGCMDIEYLPRWTGTVRPEPGDLFVIGRCGAYTHSLWSEFGGPTPAIVVHEHLFQPPRP